MTYDAVDIISWMMVVIGLVGTYLNAKKEITGFYFWIISNITFMWIFFWEKYYPQAFLFMVYTVLALMGIYQWSKSVKPTHSKCPCCK